MEAGRELDALIAEKVMGLDPSVDITWVTGIVTVDGPVPGTERRERTSVKVPKPFTFSAARHLLGCIKSSRSAVIHWPNDLPKLPKGR